PIFIGIQGPQGSGKSTLVQQLLKELPGKVQFLSVDDLYLTNKEQSNLTSNPLLKYRGLPGTHDIKLGKAVLESLNCRLETKVPRYDKSLLQGRGDRLPENQWDSVSNDVDIVLVEGWCLGFQSLSSINYDCSQNQLGFNIEHLNQVNENLKEYEAEWYPYLDYFVQIKADDIQYVYDWRWQQEQSLKLAKGEHAGLNHNQVIDFVNRFMPMYELYLPQL
ncbi:P-loop containing nucleoside triphosphate hydrolase protein, partial [Globomyces pollinis-pini]